MLGTLVASIVLLLPATAFAFGPVAHVDLGLELIGGSALAAAGVGAILRRHATEFLHGTLAADRELAKNLAPYERHSHNWQRAFEMLDAAGPEREQAFFLGYLAHLAADTVAHNFYVPAKMTESFRARLASHAYWEMRYDARLCSRSDALVTFSGLARDSREEREFLRKVVPGNLVGPRIHVGLTGLAMRFQRANAWTLASVYTDRMSRLVLTDSEEADVRGLALAAQVSVLTRLERSPIVALDPRGLEPIEIGRHLRRRLRALYRGSGRDRAELPGVVERAQGYFRGLVAGTVGRG